MARKEGRLRVVVKVGTSTLTHDTGRLNLYSMERLSRTLSDLEGMGHEIILVSSGAIGIGTAKMGLAERPTQLRMKQAAAAVGQCMMMHLYDKMFGEKHRMTLQLGVETSSTKTEGESDTQYGYLPDRGETFSMPPLQYEDRSSPQYYDNPTYAQGSHTVLNRVENKMSEYGMAVYTYDDRYVLNVSGRVDASNRFGQDKNKRFQPTWSVGLKWRLCNEPFARGKWWANNMDIYASYGYQGNAVSTVSPESGTVKVLPETSPPSHRRKA